MRRNLFFPALLPAMIGAASLVANVPPATVAPPPRKQKRRNPIRARGGRWSGGRRFETKVEDNKALHWCRRCGAFTLTERGLADHVEQVHDVESPRYHARQRQIFRGLERRKAKLARRVGA